MIIKKNLFSMLLVCLIAFSWGCNGGKNRVDDTDGIDQAEAVHIAEQYKKSDTAISKMKVLKKRTAKKGNIWEVFVGEEDKKGNKWIPTIKGKVIYIDARTGDVLQVLGIKS